MPKPENCGAVYCYRVAKLDSPSKHLGGYTRDQSTNLVSNGNHVEGVPYKRLEFLMRSVVRLVWTETEHLLVQSMFEVDGLSSGSSII